MNKTDLKEIKKGSEGTGPIIRTDGLYLNVRRKQLKER